MKPKVLTTRERSLLLCAVLWSMDGAPADTLRGLRRLRKLLESRTVQTGPEESASDAS